MAESLGEATLDLSVDQSGLERGMQKGEKTTRSKMSSIGSAVSKGSKVAALGIAGVGAAAIGGAAKLASFGDEVVDSAKKAGLGAEQYQEMKFAFEELGVAAPDMMMQKFNRRMGEAADGAGAAASTVEDLELQLENADGSMRDTGDVMDDTIKKLANIDDDAKRAAAAGNLFGKKAGPELSAQLGEGTEGIEAARQKAHDMGLVMDGDALEASQEFSGAMDDIKNQTLGLLRQALTPVLMFLTNSVVPIIQEKVVPTLSDFASWIGPKLTAAGQQAKALFNGIIVPAFNSLSQWWDQNGDQIIKGVKDIWSAIQTAANIIGTAIGKIVALFDRTNKSGKDMEGGLGKTAKNVMSTFKTVKKTLSVIFKAIWDIIKVVIKGIQTAWEQWGDDILRYAKSTFNNILNLIDGILTAIGGVFDVFAGIFTGDWERVWSGVKAIFSGIWDAIKAILSQAFDMMKLAFVVIKDTVTQLWNSFWDDLKETTVDIVNSIVKFVTGFPQRIRDGLANLGGILLDAGKELITGLAKGVKNAGQAVVDAVTGVLSDAWDTATGAIGGLFGSGDGPGMPVKRGGSTLSVVKSLLKQFPSARITSAFRTPAENRAAGGSTTSHHLNPNDPAVDIGGPKGVLDAIHNVLKSMGGWRELLWRVSGHFDHLHVADKGAILSRGLNILQNNTGGPEPLVNFDKMKAEMAGMGGGINVEVKGSIISERDLEQVIRDSMVRFDRRTGGAELP